MHRDVVACSRSNAWQIRVPSASAGKGKLPPGRVLARIQLIDAPAIHESSGQRPPRATAGLG